MKRDTIRGKRLERDTKLPQIDQKNAKIETQNGHKERHTTTKKDVNHNETENERRSSKQA